MLQPGLSCSLIGSDVVLEGTFNVPSNNPKIAASGPLASYEICLRIPSGYPLQEPKLYETGGKIPREYVNHVNYDGSCCFGVWHVILVKKLDMTVADLLNGPIRSYFYGQFHLESRGFWPFGELDHGFKGVVQAYASLLNCPENPRVISSLLTLLGRKWKRDRHPCPCNSGARLRDCCRAHLDAVPIRIHYKTAQPMAQRFKDQSN